MDPTYRPRRASRRRRLLRAAMVPLTMCTGVAAAGLGMLIALGGSSAVYLSGGSLHAGRSVLTLVSSTATSALYDGDAAYRLTAHADGSVVAVMAWGDRHAGGSGACTMREQRRQVVETCRFTSPSDTTTSVDSYDLTGSGVWRRTYADGAQVTIGVPPGGSVVPVAFPIGR